MATIIIKLEKKDINTCLMGCNYMIDALGDVNVILTPDALEELMNDYIGLKEIKKQEEEDKNKEEDDN